MTQLTDASARTDVLNRLRRAEGQIRGVQRMIEKAGLDAMLKEMETMLARMG